MPIIDSEHLNLFFTKLFNDCSTNALQKLRTSSSLQHSQLTPITLSHPMVIKSLREFESLSNATFLSSQHIFNDLLLVVSSNIIKNMCDSYLCS